MGETSAFARHTLDETFPKKHVAMWHNSAEMVNVEDAVITFFQRMTIVCRQRSMHRKMCPRDQSLRQCELSQPLQHTLFPSLVQIHK